ncbi:hypothetical protein [Bacillus marasmi]|uniref:hypothetical protein n=1 Tax=Bacillus marasmi TaxID=1926279 RepID=UPI0011C70789|nr:hypothetical protein [Bacillus marasmi]
MKQILIKCIYLLVAISFFTTIFYFVQAGANSIMIDSITYLRNADVEGFRDYLLSFGPYAAIVSVC